MKKSSKMNTLYSMFVRSKLEYGAIIWSPHCSTHIARIEKIQKRFIRYSLPYLENIYPLPSYESRCLHLGMISLEKRRKIQSMLFIYDSINSNIDSIELLNKIQFYVPYRLSLRHRNLFYVGLYHRNYVLNSPIIRSLNHLNSLNNAHMLEFTASKTDFKNFVLQNMK